MTWSTKGHLTLINEVTKAGGIDNFCKKYSLSQKVITDYIRRLRVPNYMTRIALAALVGLPLNSFD